MEMYLGGENRGGGEVSRKGRVWRLDEIGRISKLLSVFPSSIRVGIILVPILQNIEKEVR